MALPYVAPPGQPNGGDAGARAAGFGDYSAYQQAKDRENDAKRVSTPAASTSASGLNPTSILEGAKQVNQFYKEQNQPVIQSYEASKAPLEQRYKDLISFIKGNQQVAENRQIQTTNNELGKRGITGSSGLAQQEITNAVNPITQSFTGLQKDALNQQNIDLSNIQRAIAELSAGNPASAVQTSSGIADAARQASQFQQQLEESRQAREQQSALQMALASMKNPEPGYVTLGEGEAVYDPATGRMVYKNPKTYKASGGGDNDPLGLG